MSSSRIYFSIYCANYCSVVVPGRRKGSGKVERQKVRKGSKVESQKEEKMWSRKKEMKEEKEEKVLGNKEEKVLVTRVIPRSWCEFHPHHRGGVGTSPMGFHPLTKQTL